MQRFLLLSTIVHGLLLAGLATLRGEFVALAIPFALYLLVGFWYAPGHPNLRIERTFSNDRVIPDSDVIITLAITNLGGRIEELYLEDMISSNLSVRLGSPRRLLRLARGESRSVSYTITGPRGAYLFDVVKVEVVASVNLISRAQSLQVAGQVIVFPNVRRLKSVSIRPRRTRVYAGTIPARAGGTGTDFFGVRDYQAGDPPRVINWRASARHPQDLYTNEFQQERVADVGLVLDAREKTNVFHQGRSIFEYSVQAAAALSDAFLSQGNRVGLLVYGNYLNWIVPAYGKIQRERIMHGLAGARVGASSVFAGLQHLSPRMFPSQSQIVLVSSMVNEDLEVLLQLRARGYQILVVSPDAIRFERSLLPASEDVDLAMRVIRMERDLLILQIRRAGIQFVEWDLSKPFDQGAGLILMRSYGSTPRNRV